MNEQPNVEEREVGELIAGAGPRAAVPPEDLVRAKAAARLEWRQMVEREASRERASRRRGWLAVAAGVVLAVAVGWWLTIRTAPVAAPVVASVELLAGSARADGSELALGAELSAGVLVETGGWSGDSPAGVALRLAGGQSLRLAADSGVRLLSERRLELARGTLYIDSDPTAGHRGLEVLTALGTVRDIGTQFEVRLGQSDVALRVRVREGEVELEADGMSHRASAGGQLSLLGDGEIGKAAIDPYGPEWDWVVATAPGMEMDGKRLATVLAWVERETGRKIRYADPGLAAVAEEAILRGSSRGFTLTQTLENALLTNALRYEVENGTILISR